MKTVRAGCICALLLLTGQMVAQTTTQSTPPLSTDDQMFVNCVSGTAQQRITVCTTLLQSPGLSNSLRSSYFENRANGYRDLGQFDAATKDYQAALALVPNDVFVLYNRGQMYYLMGNYDQAIADYNASLAAPASEPVAGLQLRPDAYKLMTDRGRAYTAEGQYTKALADFDAALKDKPQWANALINHAFANLALQNFDAATADYREYAALFPKLQVGPFGLGQVSYLQGNYAAAETQLQTAADLNPAYPYTLIWLHMARLRQHKNDAADFAQRASKISSTAWPAPVVQYFLGKLSSVAVITAAFDPDLQKNNGQQCEQGFYIAEDNLIHRQTAEAAKGFNYAVGICPKNYIEYAGALAEIKRTIAPAAKSK